jgi:N-carbamoylputrescine amidase
MNLARHSAWETIQRAHAIANGVYVVVVNRVGPEGQLNFWGQSFVADPFGRIIAKAAADQEEVLVVDCDLTKIEETRQNWPFLRDRRIDAYGGLAQRFLDPDAIN